MAQISLTHKVSDNDVAAFKRDGAVRIKNVVDRDDIESLIKASEDVRENPGEFTIGNVAREEGSEFYAEIFIWKRNQAYKNFIFNSGISDIACRIMNVEQVRLFYDYLLYKAPGPGTVTPWHQDLPYYPVKSDAQICSIWLALDYTTLKSGGLEYISGSHKWGKTYAAESFTGSDAYAGTEFDELPEIEKNRDKYEILDWDLEPGDCLIHHVSTVHGAPENLSDQPRRGIAFRWMANDVKFDPRPKTAPGIKRIASREPNLVGVGDTLKGPDFPVFEMSKAA